MSNRMCCVVGCSASKINDPGVRLYSFPGKPYESELRQRWIAAVNRMNPDGSPWEPTQNSKICSRHFVGGKKSNVQTHPASVPSIFPEIYRNSRSPCKNPKKLSRSAQESSRSACKPRLSPDYAEVCVEDFLELQFGPEPQSVSFGVQVNFEPQDGNREFEFVYDRVSRACAAVQCNIPLDHDFLRPVRLWKTFSENSRV